MNFPVRTGANEYQGAYAITTLIDGSPIIIGEFRGQVSFGSTILTSAGNDDIFIAKLNRDGSYAWAVQAGGADGDEGWDITSLNDGSSIATGEFRGQASFGSTTLTSAGDDDIFIAKLNPDGSFAWAKRAGGTGVDEGDGITSLSDGSSIVTGEFEGQISFGNTILTSAGDSEAYIAKLNSDGSFAWAVRAGGTDHDEGADITSLTDGSSIVTGEFRGQASFGSTTLTSAGFDDIFIAKLNADGSFAWAKRAGGVGSDEGIRITSLKDGSSIITGEFAGQASFGNTTLTSAGSDDIFIAKLNPDGSFAWAKRAGGTAEDTGEGISSLPDGSSVITGEFEGQASFGSTTLTSAGDNDIFITKLNADGSFAWAKQAGGPENDEGFGITSLNDGSSIITGEFQGQASFGSNTLTSAGDHDIFVVVVDANGNYLGAIPYQGGSGSLRSTAKFVSAETNSDGIKVILTFNKRLSQRKTAEASDFVVTMDGIENSVTEFDISGSTIELTLAKAISKDETVTINYTKSDKYYVFSALDFNFNTSLISASVTNNSIIDANGFINPDDPLDLSIARLYKAAFSRIPDQEGHEYWKKAIKDPFVDYKDIAISFCKSAEFLAIAPPDSSHNQFVQILYQHCLYRSADAKGLGFWIDQLDSGRQDRVDVLIGFANSSENIALQETLA